MSVVSSNKTIFCEGKQGGLDYRLLDRILDNLPGERPTIVPGGSKFTFSVFARGYFFPDEVGSQKYIVLRDRDFDLKPTQNPQLLELKNAREKVVALLTHRTCVENYLLDANLIDRYWKSKYKEKEDFPTSKWGHGNSPGVQAITTWVQSSAESLKEYQAVRWALGDLLRASAAGVKLRTTWTGGSGKLPSPLTLQKCETEAKDLINKFTEGLTPVTEANFDTSLVKYQQQFDRADFWQNQDYLIWFQGKDLQKMMQKQKPNYISLNDFFDWAITRLDIAQYPDLMELRERIEQL
ncbi:MAG: hypothetical protein SXA11_01570 [Cyanobacteriota bacterium]|nr:hypothetical protein [Cyanobacteriota bacterium]